MFRQFARDSAVLAGIVIAALGVWLSRKVGNPHFDPGTTIMIGLVLTGAAFVFARKSGGLLMGDCIGRNQLALIGKLIAADIAVESVGHLYTVQLEPDSVLLTAAVCFKHGLNSHEVEQASGRLERSITAQYPSIQHLCLEAPSPKALLQAA